MALYSAVPPPPEYTTPSSDPVQQQQQQQQASSAGGLAPPSGAGTGIDIDAWTISALQSLSVSPVARGTGTPLAIPIDDDAYATNKTTVRIATTAAATPRDETPRRPPSRRDSQKKREALLKGKEGSRQRRRWENGKPPLPSYTYSHRMPCVNGNTQSIGAVTQDRLLIQLEISRSPHACPQRAAPAAHRLGSPPHTPHPPPRPLPARALLGPRRPPARRGQDGPPRRPAEGPAAKEGLRHGARRRRGAPRPARDGEAGARRQELGARAGGACEAVPAAEQQ